MRLDRGIADRHHTKAPTEIEPVDGLLKSLEPKVRLYVEHFLRLGDGDESS